jgi:hypothetical protein
MKYVAFAFIAGLFPWSASSQGLTPAPYTVRAVAPDTEPAWRWSPRRHGPVVAAFQVPPLAAASLPPGWREVRISDGGDDGMVRSYRMLRIVWSPSETRGEVLSWWRASTDRDFWTRGTLMPQTISRVAWGCSSLVEEGPGVRTCVLPIGNPESWDVAGAFLEKAVWGPWITAPPRRPPAPLKIPRPPGSERLRMPSMDHGVIIVRTDTVYQCNHRSHVVIEHRQGSRYTAEVYTSECGRRDRTDPYDRWATIVGEVYRLLGTGDGK